MTNFLIEEIKHLLSQRVGIRIVSPSDCAVIALAITKKLRKNISETTIKRLYGFAAQENQFSKFTINTLLEFVHHEESENYASAAVTPSLVLVNNEWEQLWQRAKSISETTVNVIKNTCTIPYECTVDRKFAGYDLDYFYQSTYSFTVFVAQSGYGKSVMLSHLVQNQFLNATGKYHKDIVCFLHATKIINLQEDQQQLTVEIQKMLGLSKEKSLVDYFDEQYEEKGKKLIIFIDGFADLCQNNGDKPKVFSRLLQLFDDIQDSQSIKVVLTMRSYMWRRFFEKIRHSHYLKTKWFAGSYLQLAEQSNIPALTDSEVSIVLNKLDAESQVKVNSEIRSLFRHPFYLSYYYMLQESYANTDYLTHLISYEVVLRHVLNKIYQAKHPIEKVILCKRIIHLCECGKKGDRVPKIHLLADQNFHKNAYMELLLAGILAEEQRNENGLLVEFVHFVQPHIFDYFLFKENLELHRLQLSAIYFDFIFENYQHDRQQLCALLKWSLFKMVKTRQFDAVQHFLKLDLTGQEFNQLLLFLSKNIKHQLEIDPDSKIALSSSILNHELIKKFPDLDFLDPCYKEIIAILIETTADDEILADYYAILLVYNGLTFNVGALDETISKLKKLNFNNNWLISPLTFGEVLLGKLTGHATSQLSILDYGSDLIRLEPSNSVLPSLRYLIAKLFLVHFQWIFGSPIQTTQLLARINQSDKLLLNKAMPYSRYVLSIWTLEMTKLGFSKKASQLLKILNHLENSKFSRTKSQCCNDILKIVNAYDLYNRKEYEEAISLANRCVSNFRNANLISLELSVHQLLVKVYTALNDIDKANEHRYIILNRLENAGLPTQLFDRKINYMDILV